MNPVVQEVLQKTVRRIARTPDQVKIARMVGRMVRKTVRTQHRIMVRKMCRARELRTGRTKIVRMI
jgi:hypothetical protein